MLHRKHNQSLVAPWRQRRDRQTLNSLGGAAQFLNNKAEKEKKSLNPCGTATDS
jgi:hypothetical protein